MVVKMMRWPPWPLVTRKYEVKLCVNRLEGFSLKQDASPEKDDGKEGTAAGGCDPPSIEVGKGLTVEIRWKGPKATALMSSLRNIAVKREFTKEAGENDGVFSWQEEFQSVCSLSAYYKDNNQFHPWEIGFTVLNVTKQGQKNKTALVGTAWLNLAEFASKPDEKEFNLTIPLSMSGPVLEPCPALCMLLSLQELRTTQEPVDSVPKSIVPATASNEAPEAAPPLLKDDLSALKAGLKKVKILTGYMSSRRVKKVFRGSDEDGSEKCELSRSEEDGDYLFDSDSYDEYEDVTTDEGAKEELSSNSFRKSFSYGSLAYANYAGSSFFSSARVGAGGKDDEDWVYYSHRKSDVGYSVHEEVAEASEPPVVSTSRRGISLLPWKKRKLNFRSPKAKGEPLLKKDYAEGGDDIDYDRRQLSPDELALGWPKSDEDSSAHWSSVSEFGDDSFAVGSWEYRDITSRDGQMKLQTQVFFASIDQRSEKAAGESACTVLVAVIADWFQNNRETMPIKSQLDTLIRDGSSEWRNLCEDSRYRERFPDKHFDLETVLQAKIRPLSVQPERSFIGFFHPPEGALDGDKFDFLQGAMSLDNIWEEISRVGSSCSKDDGGDAADPQVYVVSWNDHFFVLKVEPEAYYIIDTLGERLYEGCNQAYMLKFDRNTKITRLPPDPEQPEDKGQPGTDPALSGLKSGQTQQVKDGSSAAGVASMELSKVEEPAVMKSEGGEQKEDLVCQGKESCKEYIKSFMAAIPIREVFADLKKGLVSSTPLHHRLQIEFNYTHSTPPLPSSPKSAWSYDVKTITSSPHAMEEV